MSDPFEDPINDLFDFPEVGGLEEFGLVPPVPSGQGAQGATDEPAKPAPAAAAEGPQANAPAADDSAEATVAAVPARPNPPVPEGINDLDEDLFQFEELFSLDDDPYSNCLLYTSPSPRD